MNLGATIKDIRRRNKLSQGAFADICGISQTYLSQIENNLKDPAIPTLKVISKHLGVPLPIVFFLSMTKDDIHPDKIEGFDELSSSLKLLVNELISV